VGTGTAVFLLVVIAYRGHLPALGQLVLALGLLVLGMTGVLRGWHWLIRLPLYAAGIPLVYVSFLQGGAVATWTSAFSLK
jgi:hypothetical protein